MTSQSPEGKEKSLKQDPEALQDLVPAALDLGFLVLFIPNVLLSHPFSLFMVCHYPRSFRVVLCIENSPPLPLFGCVCMWPILTYPSFLSLNTTNSEMLALIQILIQISNSNPNILPSPSLPLPFSLLLLHLMRHITLDYSCKIWHPCWDHVCHTHFYILSI